MGARKRHIFIAAGLLVTALVLWYYLRRQNWSGLVAALRAARYGYLVPSLAFGMVGVYLIKAWRWGLILTPIGRPSFRHLYTASMIGFMGNCVLPGRLGEPIRAVVLRLRADVPASVALGTIAVERMFDMITVVLFMFVAFAWLSWRGVASGDADSLRIMGIVRYAGVLSGLAALTLLLGLVTLRWQPRFCHRAAHAVMAAVWPACAGLYGIADAAVRVFSPEKWHTARAGLRFTCDRAGERLRFVLTSFISGLSVIRGAGQAAAIMGLSIAHWTCSIAAAYFASLCFPDFRLGWWGATLVFVFTAFAAAIPQGPGFVGTVQLAAVAATTLAAGHRGSATHDAYANLVWGASVIPVIVVGFVCLWAEGLSLRHLRGEVEKAV